MSLKICDGFFFYGGSGWLCFIFALRQGPMSLRLASNLFLAQDDLELPVSTTSRHVPPCPVLKWLSDSCVVGSLSLQSLLSRVLVCSRGAGVCWELRAPGLLRGSLFTASGLGFLISKIKGVLWGAHL